MTSPLSAPISLAASAPHAIMSGSNPIPWLPADASWLSILQGCVPVAIAAIVAWVGFRQLVTTRAKLKLDLFEKRLAIFDVTWEVLSNASQGKVLTIADMIPFQNKFPEAAFLFGSDIEKYMTMVRQRIIDDQISMIQLQKEGYYASDELKRKHQAAIDWFAKETLAVKERFRPYLGFERWR